MQESIANKNMNDENSDNENEDEDEDTVSLYKIFFILYYICIIYFY